MYASLEECLIDLEKNGHLIRVTEPIDPNLEMAAVHLRVHEQGGPALLFENVIGSKFRAASNIFGTIERSKFIFRNTWDDVKKLVDLRSNPIGALKKPFQNIGSGIAAIKAFPKKSSGKGPVQYEEINIEDIPQIKHWPMDGGAFITLPQVYTEDLDKPGIMNANLGMYRIQLSGNDYIPNKEIGLHYQIHRGIGIHQSKADAKGVPLKVSCFVGGPPAHTLSAVMPLPEGLSEMTFGGLLAGRRFRYGYEDGFCISHDADFVITGTVEALDTKPEGPFGDHLGYYSLTHPFPVLKVHKVYARKNAIWPFTVVGRPPQEDTAFGALIHHITGNAMPSEIPGVKEVHAVDAAGVHPLLFAIGSERYTPYLKEKKPAELLTIANHILGTNQLSLAKFLFIAADDNNKLSTHEEAAFLQYILERIHLDRDIHFYTNTTIDTLDYSGEGINSGSKVVFAAYGDPIRTLTTEVPAMLQEIEGFYNPKLVMPGVIAIQSKKEFNNYDSAINDFDALKVRLKDVSWLKSVPLLIVCDDSDFLSANLNNFLWTTFTRSNPSHDIHGVNERIVHKHWACDGLIIDSRKKPHHAPALIPDEQVTKNIERFFKNGASLQKLQ